MLMSQRQARKKKKLGKAGARQSQQLTRYFVPRIQQYAADWRLTRKYRFAATAAVSTTITRANLLDLVVLPTTTSACYRLFTSVRVVSIEVWGEDPLFASAATEVEVEWTSEDGPNTSVSSMSCGDQPAHIKTRPPKRSLAGFWGDAGYDESTQLFTISVPIGSTIDLMVETVMPAFSGVSLGPTSVANLTVGQVTMVKLDGKSGVLTPVDQKVFAP